MQYRSETLSSSRQSYRSRSNGGAPSGSVVSQPSCTHVPVWNSKQVRIQRLQERLYGLQTGMELERSARIETIHTRLKDMESRVALAQDTSATKIANLSDEVNGLHRDLDEQLTSLASNTATQQARITNAELKFSLLLAQEQEARREVENRLLNSFSEKSKLLFSALQKEKTDRLDNEQLMKKHLEEEIPQLLAAVKEESGKRAAMEERLMEQMTQRIRELEDELETEKMKCCDIEEAMLKMIEELVNNFQNELQMERADRERSESTLVELLEETCNKLDLAFQRNVEY